MAYPDLPPNYKILRAMGRGAYGRVIKCFKEDTREMVAVKVLHEKLKKDRQPREVEMMEKLQCLDPDRSNIVRYCEWFHREKQICIVYELLDLSLREYLCSTEVNIVSLHGVRIIIRDLATALNNLKEVGVIHADLKPDNIMFVDKVKRPFRVKLIDFGLARHTNKVVTGMLVQPRSRRAPEVLLGLPFNEAIDVWSLGTVMADLLFGFPVFSSRNEHDLLCCITAFLGEPPKRLLNDGMFTETYYNRRRKNFRFQGWTLKTPNEFNSSLSPEKPTQQDTPFTLEDLKQTNLRKDDGVKTAEWHVCVDLLTEMLQMDPRKRITPSDILAHPFMTENGQSTSTHPQTKLTKKTNCKTTTNLISESISDYDLTDDSGVMDIEITESSSENFWSFPPDPRNNPVESPQFDARDPKRTRIRKGICRFLFTLRKKFFPNCLVQ